MYTFQFFNVFFDKKSTAIYSVLLYISATTTPNVGAIKVTGKIFWRVTYRGLTSTDVAFMSVPVVSVWNRIDISEPEQVKFAFHNTQAVHSCKKEKIQTSKVHISKQFLVR